MNKSLSIDRILLLVGAAALIACGEDPLRPGAEGAPLLMDGDYGQWLWSRNGAELLFLTYPYSRQPAVIGAVSTTTGATRTVASSSTTGRRILNRGLAASNYGVEVVLSEDGSHVYYLSSTAPQHHEDPADVQLHRVRLDGSSAPELVAANVGFFGYAVSPDMTRIAFNGVGGVQLLDVTTGERTVVSSDSRYGVVPASWSPDGRTLLATQNRPGSHGRGFLWLDLTSGLSHAWSMPGGIALGAPPHPVIRWIDNRPVLLSTNQDQTALVRCDIGAGDCTEVRLPAGNDVASSVSWSDNGLRAVFWRSECVKREPNTFWGGTYCTRYSNDLRLLDVELAQERSIITVIDGAGGGDVPVFAPDGRRIAYTAGFAGSPPRRGLVVRGLP
jgi:dipeptidyl aminopeptidase/acylaminoacyl peptidase